MKTLEVSSPIHDVKTTLADIAVAAVPSRHIPSFREPQGPCAPLRKVCSKIVSNVWFDWFILFLIGVNTILLMAYQYTDPDCTFNWVSDKVIDPILLSCFTGESVLKIIAWGLVFPVTNKSCAYLCDSWNWLDFVVVVSGWVTMVADGDGLTFLRLFRVLRPLRSLTMVPEMRDYVCTVLNSIRGLIDVMLMAIFIFTVFAIVGITLWGGIFYRRCRTTQQPVLSNSDTCWEWASGAEQRLCGGYYECPSGEWCGGHPDDPIKEYRPWPNGDESRGLPWCDNGKDISEPKKTFPETDFIHFDHFAGALLVVFQSMTMEGWIEITYMVQDGTGLPAATFYFIMVILVTSFFVLNVILAVISESYTELEMEQAEEREREAARKLAAEREAVGKSVHLYGIGTNRNVYKQSLTSMDTATKWTAVSGGTPVGSIAIDDDTIYGVSNDKRIYKQLLSEMTTSSSWSLASKGEIQSISIKDGTMYGIDTGNRVRKQALGAMSADSEWSPPLSEEGVISVAVKDNVIYAVGINRSIYKQTLSKMTDSSPWIETGRGPFHTILIQDDTIYAIGGNNRIYMQRLSSMTRDSEWSGPLEASSEMAVLGIAIVIQVPKVEKHSSILRRDRAVTDDSTTTPIVEVNSAKEAKVSPEGSTPSTSPEEVAKDPGMKIEAALAVFENEATMVSEKDEELWMNCAVVKCAYYITESEVFRGTVLFFIVANVTVMLLEKWPPDLHLKEFTQISQLIFTIFFAIEMVIMLAGVGPYKYVTTPLTFFDGIIVLGSFLEYILSGEGGSALTVLRIFRLFRVVVKMSSGVPAFGLLIKSMIKTVFSLGYFALLFLLVLLICTLMGMQFFATRFHFNEDLDKVLDKGAEDNPPIVSCAIQGYLGEDDKYCIPRANFDTFIEGFTTIFQIMSGENWNTVMYDAMRARGWFIGAVFFVFLILFGQTLMLNLFLTILMAKFEEASETLRREEREKKAKKKAMRKKSLEGARGLYQEMKKKGGMRTMGSEKSVMQKSLSKGEAWSVTGQVPTAMPIDHGAFEYQAATLAETRLAGAADGAEATPLIDARGPSPIESDSVESAKVASMPDITANDAIDHAGPTARSLADGQSVSIATMRSSKKHKVYPDRWPYTYALLIFHRDNIFRKACQRLATNPHFDNFILACILLSSICMAIDTPLRNPGDTFTQILRTLDTVFSVIFIGEMLVKLVALGVLLWSPTSYLLNGWNVLDGIVVIVSIVDLFSTSSTGFLKTLRILRAFRPLRVIARNQNLKVVVTTIFRSLPELVTLVFVSMIFLLICSIVLLQYLNGKFYTCDTQTGPGMGPPLQGEFEDFVTPLCIGSLNSSVCPRGTWDGNKWITYNSSVLSTKCGSQQLRWQRPSADTPICVGRCSSDHKLSTLAGPPQAICPPPITRTEELPSVCPSGELNLEPSSDSRFYQDELRGSRYVQAMLNTWVMPCGSPSGLPGGAVTGSCRDLFCPDRGSVDSCESDCKNHPQFCFETCKSWRKGGEQTEQCRLCQEQCKAWCECEDYCEPLAQEAAVCVEQGGKWGATISQNFNTISNSMLTLFELTTTEGWVDVMYSAIDQDGPYMSPKRTNNVELWSIVFIIYIFMSNMFIINLSVGVIVENFINIKKETGSVALTKAQERWIVSQRSLYGRACLFQLTNLHHKPKYQRQAYLFSQSPAFENTIMTAIVMNTLLMACNVFPLPMPWWTDFLQGCNYLFATIFFIEFIIKFYALRRNYWKDSWNIFDFFCVLATFAGITVKAASDANIGSVMSVIRIFRIARLFRLLRFMKGLNKIFMALVFSVPKLINVSILLVLLLCLYSILGVQLFATVKFSDTHNEHGNFRNFFWAFVTLFRSMTGEAWNEIMHDLAKGEWDFLQASDWCSPANLFNTEKEEDFNILEDKCLIKYPNACGDKIPTLFTKVYFVTYTIVITFTVLNLVIAVILEGYEDGKEHTEAEVIDTCIRVWKKYDTDCRMFLPMADAFRYVDEVLKLFPDIDNEHRPPAVQPSSSGVFGMDLATIPMRYANDFDIMMTEDGTVHFMHVAKLVLQIVVSQNDPRIKTELKAATNKMSEKDRSKLSNMESRQLQKNRAEQKRGNSLRAQVAASKIQKRFKARRRMGDEIIRTGSSRLMERHMNERMSTENFSEPPPPDTGGASIHFLTDSGPEPTGLTQEHLEPRSPANVDGLDMPGRTKFVTVSPNRGTQERRPTPDSQSMPITTPSTSASATGSTAPAAATWADGSGILHPPPGG